MLVLTLLLPPSSGLAQGADSGAPCTLRCQTPACHAAAGRCLLRANEPGQAKALLKRAAARSGDHVELHLLLAKAYWDLGNKVWARRVLFLIQQKRPDDCLARSWLAMSPC